jgi:hypothetical protein
VEQVPWARDLAQRLLAEPLPRRWAHTQGVARKAESITHIVGDDAELLICAAWLHDIGYSPSLATTGFHPLDGARYLRDIECAGPQLCRLVAHHSCAAVEAKHRDMIKDLLDEFPHINGLLLDALTYCDMTTSPNGEAVNVKMRLHEIAQRYGDDSIVAKSIRESALYIIETIRNIQLVANQGRPE